MRQSEFNSAGRPSRGLGFLLAGLLALLIPMLALRLAGAAACAFWYDEIFSLKISQHTLADLSHYAALDVHPSTYYFLMHFFIKFASAFDGRLALVFLRLSSALPNLLLVLALAWWAFSRWGRPAGWAALVAAGFAPGMVYYSIELRNYSLTMCCVGLSCLCLVKVLAQPSPRWKLFYVLATLAFLHLHYVAMAIYACQAAFHLAALFERRRRGEPVRWAPALWPHAAILLLLLPELSQIWVKYRDYYAPANMFVYNARFSDLYRTFAFDFPAGPQAAVLSGWDRFFEWFAQGASLLFYAVLGCFWYRDRNQYPLDDLDRTALRLCLWMLGSYLIGTWFISVMKWSLVYSPFRTAMLVLSLWILLVMTVIETGIRPRLRPVLRWAFALWMVPCAFHAVLNRIPVVDDLRPLRDYARNTPNPSPADTPPVFYLDDAQLAPWLQRVEGSIRIEPLTALLTLNPLPRHPVRVITHTAADLRVRLPREVETVSFLRVRSAERGDAIQSVGLGGFELYIISPHEIPGFVSELKRIATGASTGWFQRLNPEPVSPR